MAKSIVISDGKNKFLAEIDDSVEVPDPFIKEIIAQRAKTLGIPEGTEVVVNLGDFERSFEEIKSLIIISCSRLFEALKAIPEPTKSTAQFGIKLAGETGFPMLAKASGEASITVTVEWSK